MRCETYHHHRFALQAPVAPRLVQTRGHYPISKSGRASAAMNCISWRAHSRPVSVVRELSLSTAAGHWLHPGSMRLFAADCGRSLLGSWHGLAGPHWSLIASPFSHPFFSMLTSFTPAHVHFTSNKFIQQTFSHHTPGIRLCLREDALRSLSEGLPSGPFHSGRQQMGRILAYRMHPRSNNHLPTSEARNNVQD